MAAGEGGDGGGGAGVVEHKGEGTGAGGEGVAGGVVELEGAKGGVLVKGDEGIGGGKGERGELRGAAGSAEIGAGAGAIGSDGTGPIEGRGQRAASAPLVQSPGWRPQPAMPTTSWSAEAGGGVGGDQVKLELQIEVGAVQVGIRGSQIEDGVAESGLGGGVGGEGLIDEIDAVAGDAEAQGVAGLDAAADDLRREQADEEVVTGRRRRCSG